MKYNNPRATSINGERMTSGGFTDDQNGRIPHGRLNKVGSISHLAVMDRELEKEAERADFARRDTFGGRIVNNAPDNLADLADVFQGIQDSLDSATELSGLTSRESDTLKRCSDRLQELEEMRDPIKIRFIIYEGLLEIQREINHVLVGHLHEKPGLSGQSQNMPKSELEESGDKSDIINDIDANNQ